MRERELWWLNPAYVAGIMGALLTLAAFVIPESMYRTYWRTPKFFDGAALRMVLACVGIFTCGAMAGGLRRLYAAEASESDWTERVPWKFLHRVFNSCFYLSLLGYVAWAAAAISRGATLELALGVVRGDKGASALMKEVYLGTISGITTLTQLAIVCLLLAVLIGVREGWWRVMPKCGILLVLTLIRALLNSERLAVMELVIPAAVLFVRLVILDSPRVGSRLWNALRAAPALGYSGLIVVFGASEYFRSWINFYAGRDMSFWQFVSSRLLGYYVTALNNGALLTQRIDPTGVPFFTFHLLWRFPVLSGIVDMLYPSFALAAVETDPYMRYLAVEANPEFNNGGGFLLPVLDFGFAGALLYWLLAGIVCGVLYRLFQQKRMGGLLFYPVVFVGAIELTRIIYWAEGRVFVPLCVLAMVALACRSYGRRYRFSGEEPEWQPSH
ncbi:MAG TPA: O-antigen polymerase [Bryobacteraceae bacterium]